MRKLRKLWMPIFLWMTLLVGGVSLPNQSLNAQCPMCRMSVESNYKNGGTAGKGLNIGILYMLAMPYLLVGTIGYLWWRNRNRDFAEDEQEQ